MLGIVAFALQVYLVLALPGGPTPTRTPFPSSVASAAVVEAPQPTTPPHHDLLRRNGSSNISANICGWIDGKISQ